MHISNYFLYFWGMAYENLKDNKNAEEWTFEKAEGLFNDALELSVDDEYDFIGEVARDLNQYRDVFKYLSGKFPQLKTTHNRILSNLEANCFSHAKKGKIKEATAIVNLKSNYGWTDRSENKNTNTNYNSEPLSKQEIKDINDSLEQEY